MICLLKRWRSVFDFLLVILVFGSTSGCATSPKQDGQAHHYFGYVKILGNDSGPRNIHAEKVFFVGAKISDGIQLGVSNSRSLSIPLDCRTVILVANSSELKEATSAILKLGLNKTCVGEL